MTRASVVALALLLACGPAGADGILNGGTSLVPGQLPGTSTNDNAASGNVGQIVESDIPVGSAGSLVSGSPASLTSINVPPGDWDISAIGYYSGSGTTTVTSYLTSISTTTNVQDQTNGHYVANTLGNFAITLDVGAPVMPSRFSFSVTTTVFLVVQCTFGVSTLKSYGHIRARRVR